MAVNIDIQNDAVTLVLNSNESWSPPTGTAYQIRTLSYLSSGGASLKYNDDAVDFGGDRHDFYLTDTDTIKHDSGDSSTYVILSGQRVK